MPGSSTWAKKARSRAEPEIREFEFRYPEGIQAISRIWSVATFPVWKGRNNSSRRDDSAGCSHAFGMKSVFGVPRPEMSQSSISG